MAENLLVLIIFPTPKLIFTDSSIDKSLMLRVIENTGLTLHFVFNLLLA